MSVSESQFTKSFTARKQYAAGLEDNAASRKCAKEAGLTKSGWVAKKASQVYAIRGPDGKCYGGIREAKAAHDALATITFMCLRKNENGEVCGMEKSGYSGSQER